MKTVTINQKTYPVYATPEDADEYFAAVFNSTWQTISPEDKAKLLVSATRKIDQGQWRGQPVEENQELKFPRIIAGKETDAERVQNACCEEAGAIYSSGTTVGKDTTGIKSMRVQDTEIQFLDNRTAKQFQSDNAYDLLKPYRATGTRIIY